MAEELPREMLDRRQAILDLMVNPDGSVRDVLYSELREKLGINLWWDDAFEGLRKDGVIKAYFPEAKPGDSGRQYWSFTNVVALPPRRCARTQSQSR